MMSKKKYELTEAEEAAANLLLEREREYLKDINKFPPELQIRQIPWKRVEK